MDRRRALLTALLATSSVFAGCTTTLGGGGTPTPTHASTPGTPFGTPTPTPFGTPTPTPFGTPTATPGECDAVEQDPVDPFREDVEPSELPDSPEEWNRSSVEEYVVAFERAWSRNGALRTTSTNVEVIVGDVSVERSGDEWVVELTSRTNTWAQGRATGTATATVVHGDGAKVPVTYRLTDRALYREEGRIGGTPSSSVTSTPERLAERPVACFGAE
jgi:hypothetical protein